MNHPQRIFQVMPEVMIIRAGANELFLFAEEEQGCFVMLVVRFKLCSEGRWYMIFIFYIGHSTVFGNTGVRSVLMSVRKSLVYNR